MALRRVAAGAVAGLLTGAIAVPVTAEAAIIRGLQQIIGGVLHLPLSVLSGTVHGPPIVGTVTGALSGAVSGLGLVTQGALELASSAIGLARTAAPFVLPFLL